MNQDDESYGDGGNNGSGGGLSPGSEQEHRLKTAYGGMEHVEDFHLIVEKRGQRAAVASGMAISFTPTIDLIYAVFADAIEYQYYSVGIAGGVAPSGNEIDASNPQVHHYRQEGRSEWGEPWSVGALFEEHPGGWLVPTELRFGGLAKYAPLNEVIDSGIEGGSNVLKDLV